VSLAARRPTARESETGLPTPFPPTWQAAAPFGLRGQRSVAPPPGWGPRATAGGTRGRCRPLRSIEPFGADRQAPGPPGGALLPVPSHGAGREVDPNCEPSGTAACTRLAPPCGQLSTSGPPAAFARGPCKASLSPDWKLLSIFIGGIRYAVSGSVVSLRTRAFAIVTTGVAPGAGDGETPGGTPGLPASEAGAGERATSRARRPPTVELSGIGRARADGRGRGRSPTGGESLREPRLGPPCST
jgi:hypothetical protein